MGFDWDVSLKLKYCVPIKIAEGVSFWYMLKRLAEYEPGYAKRAHDATVTDEPLARTLLNRASQSILVLIDSPEYCKDEVEKEVKNPTPIEKRFQYNPGLGQGEYRDFDLGVSDPGYTGISDLLVEAFEFAASKVLGEGHDFTLECLEGGYRGDRDRVFFIRYKPLEKASEGSLNPDGHARVNIPWGVASMTVPAAPPGVAQQMERLMSAFGLEAEGEGEGEAEEEWDDEEERGPPPPPPGPGWHVVTLADGG